MNDTGQFPHIDAECFQCLNLADDFASSVAENARPKDIAFFIEYDLHFADRALFRIGTVDIRIIVFVNTDRVAVLFACLRFRQTRMAEFRVGVCTPGHMVVIHFAVDRQNGILCRGDALCVRHMR